MTNQEFHMKLFSKKLSNKDLSPKKRGKFFIELNDFEDKLQLRKKDTDHEQGQRAPEKYRLYRIPKTGSGHELRFIRAGVPWTKSGPSKASLDSAGCS